MVNEMKKTTLNEIALKLIDDLNGGEFSIFDLRSWMPDITDKSAKSLIGRLIYYRHIKITRKIKGINGGMIGVYVKNDTLKIQEWFLYKMAA